MSKKTEYIIKAIMAAITIAIIFYNIGIATTLKHMKPHYEGNGVYQVELFGDIYTYED